MNQELLNLDMIRAEKCRRSFLFFIKEFWEIGDPSQPIYNWHIEYIASQLENILKDKNILDTIINLPPGSSKTMIVSVLFPAWLWTKNPKYKIITASYSSAISLDAAEKSKKIIDSDKYRKYFPYVKIQRNIDQKSKFATTEGGVRFSTSTGSALTGIHADILIGDDLQSAMEVESDNQRNSVNNWVISTFNSRKTDKRTSHTIYVQQRLHPKDITSFLTSMLKNYNHIIIPVVLNKNIKPLDLSSKYIDGIFDINRLDNKIIKSIKEQIGNRIFNAQYLQEPNNEEDSIIKREWIDIIDYNYIDINKYEKNYFIDTAYGEKNSDNSVILECIKTSNELIITNLLVVNEDFPTLINSIKRFCSNSKKIYIEGKANGKSIIQTLKNETHYNIIELSASKSKIERLISVSPIVEGKRVKLLSSNWNDRLLDEVCQNEPKNDDIRDCFCYAIDTILIKGQNYGKYSIK